MMMSLSYDYLMLITILYYFFIFAPIVVINHLISLHEFSNAFSFVINIIFLFAMYLNIIETSF